MIIRIFNGFEDHIENFHHDGICLVSLVWFDFCFTALQHILGHFGRGQLT